VWCAGFSGHDIRSCPLLTITSIAPSLCIPGIPLIQGLRSQMAKDVIRLF
jgi:hypothetical protein